MPDRLVYLVDEVTAVHKGAALEFVDSVGLADLLGQGFETSTVLENQQVACGGKKVKATMMILKQAAENRGVTATERGPDRSERSSGGAMMMTVTDQFGFDRQVSLQQAMVESQRALVLALDGMGRHVGHLGAPGNHNMPGLTIISGEVVAKAQDMGMLAGARGEPSSANPFPPGTEASTKWLQGYKQGQSRHTSEDAVPAGVSPEDHEEQWLRREKVAFDEGKAIVGTVPDDAVVHNPYQHSHPRIRAAWTRGFTAGGGVVEP